jgi:hypothetical protein
MVGLKSVVEVLLGRRVQFRSELPGTSKKMTPELRLPLKKAGFLTRDIPLIGHRGIPDGSIRHSSGDGSGGRGRLDPAIFGDSGKHSSSGESSGSRGRLDPAIFGERRVSDALPEQEVQHADDVLGAERVDGLTITQLMRWKGPHALLDANDIRDGLARDANILVPLRDLQVIVAQYGGTMNLSAFVRMLGDGAKFAEQTSSIEGVQKATEEEAQLTRIADQVIGTEWETVILRSRTADDIVRGLARYGIEVQETVMHTLTSKIGKTGLVDAIKARMR